ncbi:Uncharacterised protein [Candidatus Venteria ishoeyi]|uniref:Uncharacterized protein n=1 Tax=Candidatus Venteria ishoeyi TaxID=1899563 RepID=A0A1H6F595_9GAMM|nr:Uncharacterised protein [Candidatus Venteria ishoeyi]
MLKILSAIIHPSHNDTVMYVDMEKKKKTHTRILDIDNILFNFLVWFMFLSLVFMFLSLVLRLLVKK